MTAWTLDPRQELRLVERLGQEIVRAKSQRLHLGLWLRQSRENQDRRAVSAQPHPPDHLIPIDVRQHQVHDHDVVIVVTQDLQRFLSRIGVINDGVRALEDQRRAASGGQIIFNEQYTHCCVPRSEENVSTIYHHSVCLATCFSPKRCNPGL